MEWNKEKKVDFKYIFTVPNILSYIRIILIAPFIALFLNEEYIGAAICIIISGLSDCVDGFLARKLNQITQLGKMLDPVADKLTLLAVGVCLSIVEPMVIPVIIILVAKDLLMITGASIMLKKGIMPFASEWYGKVGTVCFYVSVSAIVLFELVLGFENFGIVSLILLSLTAVIMIYSLIRYYFIFRSMLKKAKAEQTDSENAVKE
ncbi:MAG: CDP-alcohol phosphatidyltransferase family protein [Clostridia bacterium]|nr:CDP-alcohol phosphatidyltransferase family protein [Clostridia bacterium]